MKHRSRTVMRFVAHCMGAALIAIGAGSGTAFAVHQDNIFELGPGVAGDENGVTNILGDGNNGNGPDWNDLFDSTGTPDSGATFEGDATFVKDDVSAGSATDITVYSGGPGDKNQDIITDWTWADSSVPSKDDISNAYAYVDIPTSGPRSGHYIIYVGLERLDPSGASHVDFEFFQDIIALDEEPPCVDDGESKHTCSFTGENTDGDLLFNLDYTQGGTFAGLSIRERHEGVKNNYDLIAELDGEGCNAAITDGTTIPADTICAFSNGASIDGGDWDNYDNHGAIITKLETNSFAEFGFDVTAALGDVPCFNTIEVKTRSSHSFTATLKDFALQPFQQCSASATTEIHSGEPVGATHSAADIQTTTVGAGTTVHDKAIVTGTIGFATPTGTVTFKRYANSACSGTPASSEDVALSETTAPTTSTAGVAAAESSAFTTTAGGMSYQATYNADSNYTTPVDSACEPLTVAKTDSAVNTDIRKNNVNGSSVLDTMIEKGTTIVDVATVTGTGPSGDPTGKVTFKRYTTANCTGTPTSEDIDLQIGTPGDGDSTAVSSTHTASANEGEFVSYEVIYQGNSYYNPSAASLCEPICAFESSCKLLGTECTTNAECCSGNCAGGTNVCEVLSP